MSRAAAGRADADQLPSLTRRERLAVLGVWTGLGLLESTKSWVERSFTANPADWATVLAGNMPWWLMWAALTPLIIALARGIRPERNRLTFGLVHLAVAMLSSLLHHVVVGSLFFLTHTRGATVLVGGEMVAMTPQLQIRVFFNGYFILNLLTYFAVLAAYYGHEFYRRHREGELRAARLEASTHRARLAALRMELNPHFLFNTLNAVAGLVRGQDSSGAILMLARLAELLRATLEQGTDPEVPLEKELDLLSTYLEIERIRFGTRLDVDVSADRSARTALVPPMILQPLVENAVRHGVARHSGPGRVRVQAFAEGGDLVLCVTNTGPGSPPDTANEPGPGGGIGLANTQQRLAELYGSRAELGLVALAGGGAIATIRLPLRRESEAESGTEDFIDSEVPYAGGAR
ncbi:MAG TPA: histidine kinase [Longimicrobiales bacterium]|nr:histidine kinase [Longimicrobiales bacterium]